MKKMTVSYIMLLVLGVISLAVWSLFGNVVDTEQLYLDGRFRDIIRFFEANETRRDFKSLTLKNKLMMIECLARTAKARLAEKKLIPLLKIHSRNSEVIATSGIVAMALGQLVKAKTETNKALNLDHKCKRALLSSIMLHLYARQWQQAKATYDKLMMLDPKWTQSDLMFIIGLDILRGKGDAKALAKLNKTHSGRKINFSQKRKDNLKLDTKLYKKTGKDKLFTIKADQDRVAIPFIKDKRQLRSNTVLMKAGKKQFTVLLDTGNAAGWLIHSRDLRETLKVKKGGQTMTRIGSESGLLDGYSQLSKQLDFQAFKILNADGGYVAKPRPNFPDANLNPLFIHDRIVTLDFIRGELILWKQSAFNRFLESKKGTGYKIYHLPWIGFKHAYVPVRINAYNGLAMLETGAEDIALDLDFARLAGLSLEPKQRFLATGKILNYHITTAALSISGLKLKRDQAEIWSFERFHHPVTGLTPDVIIGPHAMEGNLIISFNPFTNQVTIIKK
jgi:hypothetical protein